MGRRRRFWIRFSALVILLAATTAIAVAAPLNGVAVGLVLLVCAGCLAAAWYVLLVVAPYLLLIQRLRCPACGERRLACSLLYLFRPPLLASHRCEACGSRFQRQFLGRWRQLRRTDA